MHTRPVRPARITRYTPAVAALLAATGAFTPTSRAADIYWDGVSAGWNAAANWSTAAGATTPDPAAVPGAADRAIFNITTVNGAETVSLNATQSALGLVFNNTGTTLLQGGGTNQTLNLGASGIVVNAGAGAVTIGSATSGQNIAISLAAAQAWTNNASTLLTVVNGIANGGNLLTIDGTGNTTLSGVISGGGGVTKAGNGLLILGGANTYTGINTISGGTVRGTVAASFGANTSAGAITLAGGNLELLNDANTTFTNTNTTVSSNATVTINRATSAATSTTHTLGNLSIGGQTLSIARGANITGTAVGGAVFGTTTLTGNAVMAPGANTTLTLGAVGGAFGLTQNGGGTLILNGASTYTGGTTVSNGLLQINNNAGAGTGQITLTSGATAANRLVINGGVTIANAVTFGDTFNTAGLGVLQQTGTGQGRINGAISINGTPSAGGHFVGGTAVGNELVLGGAITTTISTLVQRDGRVIYAGGGSGGSWTSLGVTGTALVGANNGIATGVNVNLGVSGNATLDLNNFNQQLNGLTLGNTASGSAFTGTVNVGNKTLALTGNIVTQSHTSQNLTHTINAVGGTIDSGFGTSITVTDTLAADDLVINGATVSGNGLTKLGTGTLALNGVNIAGELAVNFGAIQVGRTLAAGNLSTGALSFGSGTTAVRMKIGTGGDVFGASSVVTNGGTTNFVLSQFGGRLAPGTYPLISYGGASPGLSGFQLPSLPGHAVGTLVDTGSAIALNITSNDRVIWDGTNSTAWATGTTGNWKLESNSAATNYIDNDEVVFQDNPTTSTVAIAANVSPTAVTFNNTATNYTVSGAGGIAGTTGVTKNGTGTVVFNMPNQYIGATTVNAGTLELDHDVTGGLILNAASAVSIATGATLKITRDGTAAAATTTLANNLSGTGTIDVNLRTGATGAVADSLVFSGNNAGFTGNIRLLTPATGTYRLQASTTAQLGGGAVEVQSGAQLYAGAQTFTNSLSITGTGFADSAGNIGALRLESTANWAGPINVVGSARIGAHNGTATVSGAISGGDLTVNATNFNNSYTLLLTGTNTYGATIIGGQNTQTGGVPSMRLNVGNGGTTGSLGTGPVTIHGDGANGVLGFDRSDGYTLAANQSITGATGAGTIASSIQRTFIDLDTLGTGFNDNGNIVTLGTAALGGNIRSGQARTGAIANLTGTWTAQNFYAGSATRSTTNLNSGSTVNVSNLHVARTGATGSVLNINAGSTVNVAQQFNLGEQSAGNSGDVFQSGGAVTVGGHIRIAHWGSETSNYTMSGGTLTITAAPTAFPFFNSVNEVNGGIYLGIDGIGNLTQSGGTVTTGFLVLDNRGETLAGANALNGTETYTLSGGTLAFSSVHGLITRYNSTQVNLNGGTLTASAGVSPNLDSTRISVGGNVTVDTNGANTFSLYGPLAGTGTVAVTGGGTFRLLDSLGNNVNLAGNTGTGVAGSMGAVSANIGSTSTVQASRSGFDAWSGSLSGSGTLLKDGTGTLTLTGNSAAFTGTATVTSGRLNVPATFGATTLSVSDNAGFSGETTTSTATLGTSAGSTLYIDGSTAGALTAANLTLNGTTTVDFATVPTSTATPITVLNYGTLSGTPLFQLANAANYRPGFAFDTSVPGTVKLSLVTKDLVWTGTGGTTWNVNSTTNWNDSTPAANAFFAGDTVTFDDTSTNTAVTVTSGVAPFKTSVNGTSNYTLTSTTNGIAGAGSLNKAGSGTLTLVGPNTYSGATIITGGTVSVASAASLGNGSTSNSIVLSSSGKLTATAAMDLGATRTLQVDSTGGTISAAGASALTITLPGSLTGSGTLTLTSGATTAPTYNLGGANTGFTGNININSQGATSTGTTLTLNSNQALTSGTINVAAAAGTPAATSVTNTVSLNGVTISGVTLALNSNNNTATTTSQRSQLLTASGINSWNGPITLAGNDVVQLSTANVLSINGNITGTHTGTFFLRGNSPGLGFVNGTINSPSSNLNKVDTGTWAITSTGNIWNNTNVNVGTLNLGAANALPATTILNLGQGDTSAATLDLKGFNQTVAGLASNVGASGVRQITSTGTTTTTITVNNSAASTYGSGAVAIIAGNLQLVKNGAGTLTLNGTNTYTGGTQINAGIVKVGGATSVFGAVASQVTVAAGATVDGNGQNVPAASRIGTLTISGIGVGGLGAIQNTGAGVINSNFWNNLVLAGDTTIGTNSRYDIANGSFTGGTFTLTKIGTGETWWSPTPGATVGNILVNAGTFGVQSTQNLGSTAHSLIIAATAQVQTFNTHTNDKPVILNGGQFASNTATSTWNGTFTLGGTGTTNRVGTVGTGTGIVLNGKVTGNGFEKIGTGTVTLGSAANDYTGDTKVTAGVLTVAGAGKFSSASPVEMNGGTLDLAGTTQAIGGLKGASGTVTSTAAATLTATQGADGTFGGMLTGALSVVKNGTGSLTLTGFSSHAGGTLLAAGGLVVNGGLGAGPVTVTGGTLSGTGSAGAVTIGGGVFAPGNATGVFSTDNLDLAGGGFASTITGASTYGSVSVLGNVYLTGNTALSLNFSSYDPVDNVDVFTLILNDNAEAINFAGGLFTYGGAPLNDGAIFLATSGANSQYFRLNYDGNDGNDVILTAVPEPGAAALVLGGLGLLAGLQRRRRVSR